VTPMRVTIPLACLSFSVKGMESKAITSLSSEGHVVEGCDDQAGAGLMKPNLVRALIQRGALR
jgi:hypothetical protein